MRCLVLQLGSREGIPKSGVAPPWKKAFSLMKMMRCLRISLVYGKQKTRVRLLSALQTSTPTHTHAHTHGSQAVEEASPSWVVASCGVRALGQTYAS